MLPKEKLNFDKFEVILEEENLKFNENTLSNYIQKEGSFYDSFGHYLALAEKNLQNKENQYEKIYCERFIESKELGSSDKLAEAKAKCDVDIVKINEEITEAKYVVNRLKNHLKAWDKNHDNAQSMGHMLRKQMDKLDGNIYGNHGYQPSNLDREISSTVSAFEKKIKKETGFDSSLGIEGLV
jgi:hypothetical protein